VNRLAPRRSEREARVAKTSILTTMNKKPPDTRDWHERRIEAQKECDRAARAATKNGAVGLTHEARPGLGARAGKEGAAAAPRSRAKPADTKGKPRATKRGYEEPRPEPREQPSDSLAHDQERQTGMSGQSSGT